MQGQIKTDIKRLHKVVTKQITGRGYGKTFAACHEVAGSVEVGKEGDTIGILVKRQQDLEYFILPMLIEVFKEHRLFLDFEKIRRETKVIRTSNYINILVFTESDLRRSRGQIRGYSNIRTEEDLINFIDY